MSGTLKYCLDFFEEKFVSSHIDFVKILQMSKYILKLGRHNTVEITVKFLGTSGNFSTFIDRLRTVEIFDMGSNKFPIYEVIAIVWT